MKELIDILKVNEIECTFEVVKPYQHGTKRKTFTFNGWIDYIFKNKNK